MKKYLVITLSYILLFFNTNSFSNEIKKNELKIGLLAPFSGQYKDLGDSIMFSLQMALDEIGNKRVTIVTRDSGSGDKTILNNSIQEIINEGVKVIIGPINFEDFEEVKKYKDAIFISPSNINPKIENNIISIGVSLESQLKAIDKFISNQKRTKTVILYPKNRYAEMIDKKIQSSNFKNYKIFKYNPDPMILTGEIEKLTNYSQRKRNLEARKKVLVDKEDEASERELEKLEQMYTLGNVSFDSVIVIDFGNSLKSTLTSLVFSEVDQNKILFTTVNQWFDKSMFYENSLKKIYYPSVNFKNFERFQKKYIKLYNREPSEISILTYDAFGLIYYVWKKNKDIKSIKDFSIKEKIKGKIGTFSFKEGEVRQDLKIYKAENNTFTKF